MQIIAVYNQKCIKKIQYIIITVSIIQYSYSCRQNLLFISIHCSSCTQHIKIFQLKSEYLTITVEILAFNLPNLLGGRLLPGSLTARPWKDTIPKVFQPSISGAMLNFGGAFFFGWHDFHWFFGILSSSKKDCPQVTSFTFFIFISYSVCSAGVRNIDFPGRIKGRRWCDVDSFPWLDVDGFPWLELFPPPPNCRQSRPKGDIYRYTKNKYMNTNDRIDGHQTQQEMHT